MKNIKTEEAKLREEILKKIEGTTAREILSLFIKKIKDDANEQGFNLSSNMELLELEPEAKKLLDKKCYDESEVKKIIILTHLADKKMFKDAVDDFEVGVIDDLGDLEIQQEHFKSELKELLKTLGMEEK